MLTVGSLFAGIGGFDLGLERAGMRVIWQSEIDPYASAVLKKHWPEIPNHGDIRSIRAGSVERPNVLCGGFPCQDISNAGKCAGIDGERSGLWSEYARVIGELRPDYVIVENVAALLGRGIERVLGDLAALGFDAEWHCIPASAVGAPHQRDRVWIIAHAHCDGLQKRVDVAALGQQAPSGQQARRPTDGMVASADTNPECWERSLGGASGRTRRIIQSVSWNRDWPLTTEPVLDRGTHGIPNRVDRLRCLGNAIVPQIAEILGRAIMTAALAAKGEG
jgi:DNA (cytosine-5)-methyltransferase 1